MDVDEMLAHVRYDLGGDQMRPMRECDEQALRDLLSDLITRLHAERAKVTTTVARPEPPHPIVAILDTLGLPDGGTWEEINERLQAIVRNRDEQNEKCHTQFALICQMDTQRNELRAEIARLHAERAAVVGVTNEMVARASRHLPHTPFDTIRRALEAAFGAGVGEEGKAFKVTLLEGALAHHKREVERLKSTIREIRAFSIAHHDDEPCHVHLHGLKVDIPWMCDSAIGEQAPTPAHPDTARLGWVTDRVREGRGPVTFTVNENGDVLVMWWSAEGLRGDVGDTADEAIDAAMSSSQQPGTRAGVVGNG